MMYWVCKENITHHSTHYFKVFIFSFALFWQRSQRRIIWGLPSVVVWRGKEKNGCIERGDKWRITFILTFLSNLSHQIYFVYMAIFSLFEQRKKCLLTSISSPHIRISFPPHKLEGRMKGKKERKNEGGEE